jgi:hypothetical protein
MTKIIVDEIGKHLAGDARHAVDLMADLGIAYTDAEPQPIADQWKFTGVDPLSIPPALPGYVDVIEGS